MPRSSLCQVLKCFKSGRLLPFGFAQDKLTAFLAMTLSKSQAANLKTKKRSPDSASVLIYYQVKSYVVAFTPSAFNNPGKPASGPVSML